MNRNHSFASREISRSPGLHRFTCMITVAWDDRTSKRRAQSWRTTNNAVVDIIRQAERLYPELCFPGVQKSKDFLGAFLHNYIGHLEMREFHGLQALREIYRIWINPRSRRICHDNQSLSASRIVRMCSTHSHVKILYCTFIVGYWIAGGSVQELWVLSDRPVLLLDESESDALRVQWLMTMQIVQRNWNSHMLPFRARADLRVRHMAQYGRFYLPWLQQSKVWSPWYIPCDARPVRTGWCNSTINVQNYSELDEWVRPNDAST